jgi:hypothetical protein
MKKYVLSVETDWDFSLKYNNVVYSDYEFYIIIDSVDELDKIEVLGPFGSGKSSFDSFYEWIEIIKSNPDEHFSNLGGNRGISWGPCDVNLETEREIKYPEIGSGIKFYDSNLEEIKIGDKLRVNTAGEKFHGKWAIYTAEVRGVVPVLVYSHSESGKVLHGEFLHKCLSDFYPSTMFLDNELKATKPVKEIHILND